MMEETTITVADTALQAADEQVVPGAQSELVVEACPAVQRTWKTTCKEAWQKTWVKLQDWYDRIYAWASPRIDAALEWVGYGEAFNEADFDAEADWVIAHETPRGSRAIVWIAGVTIFVLLIWAAFARLDEVTRGEGKVIPSRQIQILQSLDGGIVKEILVKEGQLVQQGQVLLKIDPTRMESSLKEGQAQCLTAIAEDRPFVPPREVVAAAPEIVVQERALYESRRAELSAALGVVKQQYEQRNDELASAKSKLDQAGRSLDLTKRELDMTRPLAKTGAVSDVELLRLEREVEHWRGERDQATADISRLTSAIQESLRKIQGVELEFRNQARTELSEVAAKLDAMAAGNLALVDRVRQTEIRSPVRGTIKQLLTNTVGGVVQAGKDIIQIVPADDTLLIEARIVPKDIAFLRPGQKALVKFTAYDFSIYGGMEATLDQIGADTVTDEHGNAFYLVRVRTLSSKLGPQQLPIIPGMVAEVDILTGKKSILSYLMKPILRAKANSLSER